MQRDSESDSMRANLKVLRDFYKYSGAKLVAFGTNVSVNLDPLKFTNLKFTPAEIKTLADALNTALAATFTGGNVETAIKTKAFAALAGALDADADCVEMVVGMDLAMLLGTGYLPASTNRASSPLDDTAIVGLLNNGTTQALLQLLPVRNARTYQVQISADGGKTWAEACLSTQARRIVLTGLTPGATYFVRVRAIGGSTGASSWTSPASIIST